MTELDIKNAPQHAWDNRRQMGESQLCGCYQCLKVFPTEEIEEWTDYGKTALCPKCGCDCLIPQSQGIPLDDAGLGAVHEYWFKKGH